MPHLEKAPKLQPHVPQARALYARALKQAGRYGEAADEFRQLLEMQPKSSRWRRYAAGALSQAGQRQEAEQLFIDLRAVCITDLGVRVDADGFAHGGRIDAGWKHGVISSLWDVAGMANG